MLIEIELGLSKKDPFFVNLMVAPTTPICVSSLKDSDGLCVDHESHNNGGYRKVKGSISELLLKLEDAGAKMVRFEALNGVFYLNINSTIPLSVYKNSIIPLGLSKNNALCMIAYPTHNNGGYPLTEPIDIVLNKINNALVEIK